MSRASRQAKILELVTISAVETQEDIVTELIKHGFNATQATISRDIKELGLIKVSTDKNTYKYSSVNTLDYKVPQKFINVYREAVVTAITANNLLVIKTIPGSASAVAMVIDQISPPEMIGSVAGDDTVLIVSRTDKDADVLKSKLASMM